MKEQKVVRDILLLLYECGRLKVPTKDIRSKSLELVNVTLYGKDFADVTKLRILRLEEYPGLSRWALTAITYILTRGRQRNI